MSYSPPIPVWQKALALIIIMIVFIIVVWIIANVLTNWVMQPVTDPNWTPEFLAYGQEPDYKYSCMYTDQFPFREICKEQIAHKLDQILTACEVDESICVLGKADPDFNDNSTD